MARTTRMNFLGVEAKREELAMEGRREMKRENASSAGNITYNWKEA